MQDILIVDDDEADRRSLAWFLGSLFGDNVIKTAASGNDALAMARQFSFGLVTMDGQLPDMMGAEVVRRLRAQGYSGPVIMVAGNQDVIDAAIAAGLGINGGFEKPFDAADMQALLRTLGFNC